MTDKQAADREEGGGLGLGALLGLGAVALLAAGYAGYQLATARAASGFGRGRAGMPCAGCADKAAREAAADEAEDERAYAEAEAAAAGGVPVDLRGPGGNGAVIVTAAGDAADG